MKNRIVLLGMGLLTSTLLVGCLSNVKVSQPVSESAAGVAIKIPSSCIPLLPCASPTVTFARLGEDGTILSDEIYQTSTMKDDHYYLLNAKPGTYVAVAAAYARGVSSGASSGNVTVSIKRTFGENILFSEELVKQTKVEVVSGELIIMGEYDFSVEGRMAFAPSAAQFLEHADAVQAHYAKVIDPDMESRGVTSAVKFYRGNFKSANTDAKTKQKLLDKAYQHIGEDGWSNHIINAKP